MWVRTIFLLATILSISQSKPLEKESVTSSENVFDSVMDKAVKCMEGGVKPYLSLLNDEDQEQWRAIGREGIRSYVERMRDFLKHRDEIVYSDNDDDESSSNDEEEVDDDTSEDVSRSDDSTEEYTDFIDTPLSIPETQSDPENFETRLELTSEDVEIEKIKRK